jgi:hypothetical protein
MTNRNAAESRFEFLAAQIREDLAAAGLPIADELDTLRAMAGASAQSDPDDGVYVSWNCHYVVSVVAREEHARLQKDGPGAKFDAEVSVAMREAMAVILRASGYVFDQDYYGDYSGFALLVTGHEKVPSWRDWHEKQNSRRQQIQMRLLNAHRE